jgi:hypothetical protein
MKIQMLKGVASVSFVLKKGGVYNIPPSEAKQMIQFGYAVQLESEVIEQKQVIYENAVQGSNSTINVPNKPVGGETAPKSKQHRGRGKNNGANKKRN